MREIFENLKVSDPSFAFLTAYENFDLKGPKLSRSEIGMAFYNLGKVHYDKSDLSSAEENFLKALHCSDKLTDQFQILKTLGFLIRIASEKLENDKAQKYITLAKDLMTDLSRRVDGLSANYFYHVGLISNYMGDFKEANTNFLLAYRRAREENEPELLSKCMLSLATNRFMEGELASALEFIVQLEELLAILDKSYLKGSMHLLRGKIYVQMGEYRRALESFSEAIRALQAKKCWNLYGYVLMAKGLAYKNMGEYDSALLMFNLANDTTDTVNFKRLHHMLMDEIDEVNDSSVDIYLDRTNRKIREKNLGVIDFKHRFILLEILFLLARNSGQYFDKEQLAKAVWKDEYNPLIHDKLIYTSVSRLRKLIEPKGTRDDKRKYILRGKDGYTFNPHAKIRFHMEKKPAMLKTIANVDLSSPV